MARTKVKIEHKHTLVGVGRMILPDGKGGTIELIMRQEEPAIILDGRYIIRRSQLVRELERMQEHE